MLVSWTVSGGLLLVVLCRLRGKAVSARYASVLGLGLGLRQLGEHRVASLVLPTGLMRVRLRVPCRVQLVWVFILNPLSLRFSVNGGGARGGRGGAEADGARGGEVGQGGGDTGGNA